MGQLPLCQPTMLPLLLLLVPGLLPSAASLKSHVHRRGLMELAKTISCVGPRHPLAYISYGCYCGLGGQGEALDDTDRCCQRHDCCYRHAEEAGCLAKIESYSWTCIDQHIECGPAQDKCDEILCECDEEVAYCLAEAKYNFEYLFYPPSLCGQDPLECDD